MEKKGVEGISIDYYANIIQEIVNKAHTNHEKRRIIVKHDSIQFADPEGDSEKNNRMKRCHLYMKNLFVISYDDGGTKMPFLSFAKKYGIDIDPSIRKNINDYTTSIMIHKSDVEEDWYPCNTGEKCNGVHAGK